MNTQTQAASTVAKPAFVLAQITVEQGADCGKAIAKAIAGFEKAKGAFFDGVIAGLSGWYDKEAKAYTLSLTAKQYDKQLAPAYKAELARRKVNEKTVASYSSKLKTVVLALINNVAQPLAGETFWQFCERSAELLATAKLVDGSPIWESNKVGRKALAAGAKKTAKGGAAAKADSAGAQAEGGMQRTPEMAAALILTGGNTIRAEKLTIALANYGAEFDKWAATILSDSEKKTGHAQTKQAA